MPQHVPSALNPLVSRDVRNAAEKAFRRGASSAQVLAEVEALKAAKERTAQLKDLRDQTREQRPSRRTLKSHRAELHDLLSTVQTQLTTLDPNAAAPAAARPNQGNRTVQFQESSFVPGVSFQSKAPVLEMKPPVLDPKEIVPPHMVEQFREEFRESQRKAAAERAVAAEQLQARARQQVGYSAGSDAGSSRGGDMRSMAASDRPTLEEWRESKGHALAAPPSLPPDVMTRRHGSRKAGAFAQFGGAQSLPNEGASPTGKKRIIPQMV